MSGLEGARCARLHLAHLFESTEASCHAEAKQMCGRCPAIQACRELLREVQSVGHSMVNAGGGPVGTWAGELYGRKDQSRRPREHGTEKGYYQHKSRRERACFPCCEGMRIATNERRHGPEVVELRTCEHHDREGHPGWENKSGAESTLATSLGTSTTAPCVRGSASRAY